MSTLTDHTIDTARNGYGRFQVVPVWISVAHDERRVVLFPRYIMDEKTSSSAPGTRRLYVVDFASVCVWVTEEERLAEMVYKLLEDDCPEVCETSTLEDIGDDEESHPYEILNNRDGSPRDVPESLAKSRLLNAAAPNLLKKCKEYSHDCTTRIEVIQDEEGGYCECNDKSNHDRHCDAGEQIRHWQATREMVDAVIREAERG